MRGNQTGVAQHPPLSVPRAWGTDYATSILALKLFFLLLGRRGNETPVGRPLSRVPSLTWLGDSSVSTSRIRTWMLSETSSERLRSHPWLKKGSPLPGKAVGRQLTSSPSCCLCPDVQAQAEIAESSPLGCQSGGQSFS